MIYGQVESSAKYDAGRNVSVNGARYQSMISKFLLRLMQEMHLVDIWFQQDMVFHAAQRSQMCSCLSQS